MSSDAWQRVDSLFRSALDLEPSQRHAYLLEACGGDERVRREVQSLLAHYDESPDFLEQPALAHAEYFPSDFSAGPVTLPAGHMLGSYRIEKLLGAGGMGEVYLAEDRRLGRKVAVKCLPPAATYNAALVRRFQQEARAASALNHPNILTIYDVSREGQQHYLVSEYVEGVTLREHMRHGVVGLQEAVNIGIQIASALEAAHSERIIHRDIKPDNLIVRPDGYVKVLDFGLAKLVEHLSAEREAASLPARTKTGAILGTASYMSPEQTRGQVVDPRTDLWSWGVVFYEMLASRPPFAGVTASHVAVSILEHDPPPLTTVRPGLPPEIAAIASRALQKDVAQRYSTAAEILADLQAASRSIQSDDEAQGARRDAGATRQPRWLPRSGGEGATSEVASPAADWRARALLAGKVAVSIVVLAVASGVITTWVFNDVLARPAEFDPDTFLDRVVIGFKSLVFPSVVIGTSMAVAALVQLLGKLIPGVGRVTSRATGWLLTTIHVPDTQQTVLLAQFFVLFGYVAFFLVAYAFNDVTRAFMHSVHDSDLALFEPFREEPGARRTLYRAVTSALFLLLFLAWKTVALLRRRTREVLPASILVAAVPAVACLVLIAQSPYKLMVVNELPVVLWAGQRCYVLGESSHAARVFCPSADVPRVRTLLLSEHVLQQCGFEENVFSLTYSDGCLSPVQR